MPNCVYMKAFLFHGQHFSDSVMWKWSVLIFQWKAIKNSIHCVGLINLLFTFAHEPIYYTITPKIILRISIDILAIKIKILSN